MRALAYARHSLYNECEQCTTAGHVHLTVASVYLELAGFNKALDSFQHAHRIAQALYDPALELQVVNNRPRSKHTTRPSSCPPPSRWLTLRHSDAIWDAAVDHRRSECPVA